MSAVRQPVHYDGLMMLICSGGVYLLPDYEREYQAGELPPPQHAIELAPLF